MYKLLTPHGFGQQLSSCMPQRSNRAQENITPLIAAPLYQLYHEYLTNFYTLIVILARRAAAPFLASNYYIKEELTSFFS
jgi:hypothetical protein